MNPIAWGDAAADYRMSDLTRLSSDLGAYVRRQMDCNAGNVYAGGSPDDEATLGRRLQALGEDLVARAERRRLAAEMCRDRVLAVLHGGDPDRWFDLVTDVLPWCRPAALDDVTIVVADLLRDDTIEYQTAARIRHGFSGEITAHTYRLTELGRHRAEHAAITTGVHAS